MKKSDLATGMVVKIRNGGLFNIFLDIDTHTFKGGALVNPIEKSYQWIDLIDYEDNLLHRNSTDLDIMDVFKVHHPTAMFYPYHGYKARAVWSRDIKEDELLFRVRELEQSLNKAKKELHDYQANP